MRTRVCIGLLLLTLHSASGQELSFQPETPMNSEQVEQALSLPRARVRVSDGRVYLSPPPQGWPFHQVRRKETLWRIAKSHQVPVEVLRQVNQIEGDKIKIDQRLLIPTGRPVSIAENPPEIQIETETETETETPPPADSGGPWTRVRTDDGRVAWVKAEDLMRHSPRPLSPEEIVELARRWLGTPYHWGGQTPNGADCSGFVHELFRLGGRDLPRTADKQYEVGDRVKRNNLRPGDLVFFETYAKGASHVGIYEGDDSFIHASSSAGVVRSSLTQNYYRERFLGGRRL